MLYKVVASGGSWRWYLHANRLGGNGPDVSMLTSSWGPGEGPAELQMSTTLELTGPAAQYNPALRDAMVTTETWTQFADWNGDGRLDVIDADGGTDRYHWRVWLNQPSSSEGITWRAIQVNVEALRRWLEVERGYAQIADMALSIVGQDDWSENLPLERSRTWHRYMSVQQVREEWNDATGTWARLPTEDEDTWERTFSTNTLTEWQLADRNGDGFLDFTASSVPVLRCETRYDNSCLTQWPHKTCGSGFSEYAIAATSCDGTGEVGRLAYALNRLGPFVDELHSSFRDPRVTPEYAMWGISQWATGSRQVSDGTTFFTTDWPAGEEWRPVDGSEGITWQVSGLDDPRGTGTLLIQPGEPDGGAVRFESDQRDRCPSGDWYRTVQTGGKADLDGDGRPDLLYPPADWHPNAARPWAPYWNVRFATGAGWGPEQRLRSPDNHLFALSETESPCDPDPDRLLATHTTAGLTDMDGDGRPELLRVSAEGRLFMSRLETPAGDVGLAARRLRTIDNGHGALTTIEYGNRKQIGPRNGNVPFPEIVVTAVKTIVGDGSAPDSAPTYYGYGEPSIAYEPLAGRWLFQGYRTQATLSGTPSASSPGAVDGVMSFVDRRPRAAPGSSYAEHVLGGLVQSTTAGERYALQPSVIPWYLSGLGILHTFTGSAPTYSVVDLQPAHAVVGDTSYDCGDLKPDTGEVAGTGLCGAAGLVLATGNETWEGFAAPPATMNVLAGSTIDWIDPYGRPLRIVDRGDLRRDDDDRCTRIDYAGTVDGGPFPSVPWRVTVDDCGQLGSGGSGSTHVLAATRFHYDHLPEGQADAGLLTSRTIDRYGPTGYLDSIDAEHVEYGAFAQVETVRSDRVLGTPATRETQLQYDPFASSIIASTVRATGLPVRSSSAQISTWSTQPSIVVAPTGERTTVERDGFGRAVRTMIQPKDGVATTVRRATFHDDTSPRRVETEVFPVGAAPGAEDAAIDRQRVTTVLDAFGRARYQQRALGSDYGAQTLITGLVEYDPLGRVAFAAQPFAAGAAFDPSLLIQLPYGTTTVYDLRGRVTRSVATYGRDEQSSQSSAAGQTFVTTLSYGYSAGQAFASATGPDGNDPTDADHMGVHDVRWSTATGRELESATLDASGQVLDRVATTYDRLGHVIETQRFGAAGTAPVVWRASFDSLGRQLTMSEPGMSPVITSYDEDGNALESWWQDGASRRITRLRYDALGRLSERSLARSITTTSEVVEATDRYHYDEPFGPHASGPGSYLGRLAAITTDGVGGVYYAYDELGRATTTTYDYAGQAPVRELAAFAPGGRLTELALEVDGTTDRIAYDYDSAARVRRVHDGAGPTVYFAATTVRPDGHYEDVLYGNGVREQFLADEGGRQQVHDWIATTASGKYAFHRDFDAGGRATHERQATPSSVAELTYTYDPLGRLRQALQVGGDNDGLEWFTHDALGNLTTRMATTAAGSREYTYDAADPDRLCRYAPMATTGPCQFTYDGAGNVIADTTAGDGALDLRKLTYDSAQRLTSIHRGAVTADLTYGPLGRVVTTVTGPSPRQVWTFGGLVEKRLRADGKVQVERRIPGPLGVIASLRRDGEAEAIVYPHADGRGNRFFTDATGEVVQGTSYAPYGRVTADSGAAAPLTYSDDLWNGGDDLRELGVVLLGPRAYDPAIGRFLQRDPLVHTGSGSTGNPYSFAFGDPVNLSDPSGLDPCSGLCITATVGGGASFGFGAGFAAGVGLGVAAGIFDGGSGTPPPPRAPTALPNVSGWMSANVTPYLMNPVARSAARSVTRSGLSRAIDSAASLGNEGLEFGGVIVDEGLAMGEQVLDEGWDNFKCAATKGAALCVVERALHRGGAAVALGEQVVDDPGGTLSAIACPGGDCRRGVARVVVIATVAQLGGAMAEAGEAFGLCRGGACGLFGNCFAAGTVVQTKDGAKPIEAVADGDIVLSRNPTTGEETWKPVLRTFVNQDRPIFDLELSLADGQPQQLLVTPEHPLWGHGGWIAVADLQPGDEVWARGGWATVRSSTDTGRREDTYNFEVADFHSYFVGAGAVWAHNACGATASGLGRLKGRSLRVSEKGLALVERHLAQFDAVPQNTAMLARLRGALARGARIDGADAVFYTHELTEATSMSRLMAAGNDFETAYEIAHPAAIAKHGVSDFSVYHPDVITAFPEHFGTSWFRFWGLK